MAFFQWRRFNFFDISKEADGGSLSAAISFCGYSASPAGVTGATETWDGATWTLVAPCTASDVAAGAGTQTAALVFGGWAYPNALTRCEEYDGTSWTAGGNISIGTGPRILIIFIRCFVLS